MQLNDKRWFIDMVAKAPLEQQVSVLLTSPSSMCTVYTSYTAEFKQKINK